MAKLENIKKVNQEAVFGNRNILDSNIEGRPAEKDSIRTN